MKCAYCVVVCLLALAMLPAAEHDHSGHAHGAQHADEGVARALGSVAINNVTYIVTVYGEVNAGGDAVVGIAVSEGQTPAELRVWIGQSHGRGSVKALLSDDGHGHFHGHLEVPAELSADSAIWIEAIGDDGRKRGSVALSQAKQDHADHAGHDHGGNDHQH